MTIYLDISAAVNGKAGLGRYASMLAQSLMPLLGEKLAYFYNAANSRAAWPFSGQVPATTRHVRLGYKPWRMAVWLGQLATVGFDGLLPGAQLFHATEHLLLPFRNVPTVLTVHDLIFRLFPQHHKRLNHWFLNAAMPLFCQRATAIITISESSKRDLIRFYAVPPSKIHVIYEAAAPHFQPQSPERISAVRARYGLPENFMLAVGTIEPRKNLERVLDALLGMRRSGQDVHLVVVGSRGWLTDGFFAKLENFPAREAVHLMGYVADEDLPAMYAASRLLVLASVYEGFGLPVLEAMACGVPVVCSNTSSLPELVGDAAVFFDPLDVESMISALSSVWGNENTLQEMSRKGLAQSRNFSWARTAAQTYSVYQAALLKPDLSTII